MKRNSTLLFLLLVALPLVWLAALGVRVTRQSESDRRRLYEELMRREAETADRLLRAEISILEGRVRRTLAKIGADPGAADEIAGRDPDLTRYFLMDAEGRLIVPDPASDFPPERDFIVRTAHLIRGGDLLESAKGTESAGRRKSAPEASGWHTWFWERGLNLLVWERGPDGMIRGAEVNPARFKATMIGALPSSDAGGASPVTCIVRDTRGNRLYQWGGFDPAPDSPPDFVLPLSGPLASWTIEARLDPALGTGLAFWRATGFPILGLACAAILFVFAAAWFWRDYRRELREAADRVSFVNQVSHELKTPLTNIRLHAEMLADEMDDEEPEHARQIAVIVNESHRLSRLIGNILSFGRQRRGGLTLHPVPCDADEAVRSAVERFTPSFEEREMRTEITGGGTGTRLMDRDALEQILGNLLGNAEKYARSGNLVRVETSADGDTLIIEVRDRGPGVPPHLRERIFESFYRVHDSLTEGVSGAGIGLTLSRELARLHGGDLLCLPCPDGARFRLTLRAPEAAKETS